MLAEVQLIQVECVSCGMIFAFSQRFCDDRKNDHGTFYCPRGHGQSFVTKTKAEKGAEKLRVMLEQRDRRISELWGDVSALNEEVAELNREAAECRVPDGETPLPEDFPKRELLHDEGFYSLEQLSRVGEDVLLEIPGIGRGSANKILKALPVRGVGAEREPDEGGLTA